MSKMNRTRWSIALGTGFAIAVSGSPALAAQNPFVMTELQRGYTLADRDMGEARCGANKTAPETMRGDQNKQKAEASCAADKSAGESAMDKTAKEGKCAEAKCGSNRR